MALPDVSRLGSVSPGGWTGLDAHLRSIAFDARFVATAMRVGERLDDALRAPMHKWTLRRRREPAAAAMRLFMLGDAVTAEEARAALGDPGPFVEAGLVIEHEGGLACPFRLDIAFDRYFLSDDLRRGGDAVMGPAATSAYACLAARPERVVGSLLDVGCGAGVLAIALADRAGRVVATDVNPRALVFTGVNAQMSGLGKVELRQGDLFAPVAGEAFDLVVSQPPFVARSQGAEGAAFLYGGERGDEVALRLFSGVGPHLAPGGRAVVLVDWPVVAADPIETRLVPANEAGLDVLVVLSPRRNLEDHCTLHAAASHASLGAEFERAAMDMRDHLEAQRIEGLRLAVNVLERAPAPPGRTSLVEVRHFVDVPPSSAAVDRMLAARTLLAAGVEALRKARLRIPEGTSIEERRFESGPAGEASSGPALAVVRLPADRLVPPVVLDREVAEWARLAATAPSVGAAADGVADPAALLRAIEEALRKGVLEVAPGTLPSVPIAS